MTGSQKDRRLQKRTRRFWIKAYRKFRQYDEKGKKSTRRMMLKELSKISSELFDEIFEKCKWSPPKGVYLD